MKNGLLRFYFVFILASVALFSCENNQLTQDGKRDAQTTIERKPDERHPVEPNGSPPSESSKGKKPRRNYTSKVSNWC